MRIKFFYKILCLSFLVLAQIASAQSMPFSINLSITPANFNITDLVVNKNLSGTPRIVELTMSESGRLIVLEGEISWDENTTGDFQTMYSFTTKPFESRLRLANNDINNFDDIEIDSDELNDDLIDKQRDIGKLKGSYKFAFTAYDGVTGEFLDNTSEVKYLCNPNDNIVVTIPVSENTYPMGSVSASWTIDPCVSDYNVLVKKKIVGISSSIEEIIEAGETVIDYNLEVTEDLKAAGTVNLNLDDYIESNYWQNGDELVLLITAFNPQPIGASEIYADPIRFYIGDPSTQANTTVLVDKAQNFYDKLLSGQITMEMIKSITDENGNVISLADFQALLSDLEDHPERVISITFNEN